MLSAQISVTFPPARVRVRVFFLRFFFHLKCLKNFLELSFNCTAENCELTEKHREHRNWLIELSGDLLVNKCNFLIQRIFNIEEELFINNFFRGGQRKSEQFQIQFNDDEIQFEHFPQHFRSFHFVHKPNKQWSQRIERASVDCELNFQLFFQRIQRMMKRKKKFSSVFCYDFISGRKSFSFFMLSAFKEGWNGCMERVRNVNIFFWLYNSTSSTRKYKKTRSFARRVELERAENWGKYYLFFQHKKKFAH